MKNLCPVIFDGTHSVQQPEEGPGIGPAAWDFPCGKGKPAGVPGSEARQAKRQGQDTREKRSEGQQRRQAEDAENEGRVIAGVRADQFRKQDLSHTFPLGKCIRSFSVHSLLDGNFRD